MNRFYCDLCDKLVKNHSFLSTIGVQSIDNDSIYNRSDSVLWRSGCEYEVCLDCRVAILQKINELIKKNDQANY